MISDMLFWGLVILVIILIFLLIMTIRKKPERMNRFVMSISSGVSAAIIVGIIMLTLQPFLIKSEIHGKTEAEMFQDVHGLNKENYSESIYIFISNSWRERLHDVTFQVGFPSYCNVTFPKFTQRYPFYTPEPTINKTDSMIIIKWDFLERDNGFVSCGLFVTWSKNDYSFSYIEPISPYISCDEVKNIEIHKHSPVFWG